MHYRVLHTPLPLDCRELARFQTTDTELASYLKNPNTELKMERLYMPTTDIQVYCDTSTGKQRPFLLKHFR